MRKPQVTQLGKDRAKKRTWTLWSAYTGSQGKKIHWKHKLPFPPSSFMQFAALEVSPTLQLQLRVIAPLSKEFLVQCNTEHCWASEPSCCTNTAEYTHADRGLRWVWALSFLRVWYWASSMWLQPTGHVSDVKTWVLLQWETWCCQWFLIWRKSLLNT